MGDRSLTKADKRDEQSDPSSHSHDERLRHDSRQPLPKPAYGQNEEDDSVMSQSLVVILTPITAWQAYPSRNTAPMASRYVIEPEPWNPTIE